MSAQQELELRRKLRQAQIAGDVKAELQIRRELKTVMFAPEMDAAQVAPEPEMPEGSLLTRIAEPALSVASSVPATIAGGYAGLKGLIESGGDPDHAVGEMRSVSDAMTYEPRTQQGMEGMQDFGEFTQGKMQQAQAVSAIPHVMAGMVSSENPAEFYEQTGLDEGPSKVLGDAAYEVTGSPEVAALAYSTPTLMAELAGARFANVSRPGVKLLSNGEPTAALRGALNKYGLVYEDLSPQAQAMIPAVATGKAVAKGRAEMALEKALKDGSAGDVHAELMFEGDKVKKNKAGVKAMDNGFPRGVVARVETATPETRQGMREILKIFRRTKANNRYADTNHPAKIVGKSGVKRLKFLRQKANESRKAVEQIVNNQFTRQQVDPRPVVQALRDSLDEMGVKVSQSASGEWVPDYKESMITKNPASQKAIKDVMDIALETGGRPVTAKRLHDIKRILDNLTNYNKTTQSGIDTYGQNALKNVRYAIKEQLESLSDDYAKHNATQHEILTLFDDLDANTARKVDLFGPLSEAQLGHEMRKVMSNFQTKFGLQDAAARLDEMSNRYGGEFKDNIIDLANFTVDMNARFKTIDKTSLEGVAQRVVDDQVASTAATAGLEAAAVHAAGNVAKKGFNRFRKEKTDFDAFEAMEALLRQNTR